MEEKEEKIGNRNLVVSEDLDVIFEKHVRPYLLPEQDRLADLIRENLKLGFSHGIKETDLLVGDAITGSECTFSQMAALFCDSMITMEDIKENIHKTAVYLNKHFGPTLAERCLAKSKTPTQMFRNVEEYEYLLHKIARDKKMWEN